MLRRAAAVAAGVGLVFLSGGLTGCANGGSGSPPSTPGPGDPGARVAPAGAAGASARGSVAGRPSPAASVADLIPRDARYTIVCMSFNGPAHVQQAKVSKDNLLNATGRREFYVVHDEAQSTLYYGYYRERERAVDAAEAARVAKDLEYVRSLGDAEGHHFFAKSLVVPLPTPDPPAPPEFDLTKLDQDKSPDDPNRRFWSIAIADYTGDGQTADGRGRKQVVVEAVMDARKMGVEAYYYNGPNTSTVCIGAWPRRAIREQEASQAETRADNGQDLIVSSAPLPKDMTDKLEAGGRDVKIMQPKVEVDDPSLREMLMRYKDYSVNGRIEQSRITDPTTGKVTLKPKETFLVQIPRAAPPSLLAGDRLITGGGDNVGAPAAPAVVNPLTPGGGTNGAGRLRSVTP